MEFLQNAELAKATASFLGLASGVLLVPILRELIFEHAQLHSNRRVELLPSEIRKYETDGPPPPRNELYDLTGELSLGFELHTDGDIHSHLPPEVERLADRAQQVAALSNEKYRHSLDLASQWVDSLGRLKEIHNKGVPLRPHLATFHLGIIRLGSLAEPIFVWGMATGDISLSKVESERIVWAIALLDLARKYNDVMPWQRRPVFFRKGYELGALVLPPSFLRAKVGDLEYRFSSFRLRISHYRKARKRLQEACSIVHSRISMD